MSNRDVLITGVGLISPLGKNTAENWAKLKKLETGICHYQNDGLPEFMQYIGKIDDYHLPDSISPRQRGQLKFLNRAALFGLSSVDEALPLESTHLDHIEPGRRSLFVASGEHNQIGAEFMYPAIKDTLGKEWKDTDGDKFNRSMMDRFNPFFLLDSLHNNLFSFISAYTGFMGPGTSLSSMPPCGNQALALACRDIKLNKADIAVALGYGSWIADIARYELQGVGRLSACSAGAASYRPLNVRRDGFITGEGGAAIVLESAESAKRRGAQVFGKVLATSNSFALNEDDNTAVPPMVNNRNMATAIKRSGCSQSEIAFLISQGDGTQAGDRSELESIGSVLSDPSIPVCALKPYTGHMGPASDLAEIIFGILAVKEGYIPATLNFTETEKAFSNLNISGSPIMTEKTIFLSTSYGASGQASTVLIDARKS